MSQSGRNSKKEKFSIELSQVVAFLRLIAAMTGTLLALSVIFFLLSPKSPEATIAYVMTIAVNLAACAGSVIGAWKLDQKDEQLQEKEERCCAAG